MTARFRTDGDLQTQVGEYLHLVVNCGVLFRSGLQLYLQDRPEEFHGRLSQLRAVIAQAEERRWHMVSRYCQPSFFTRARADLMACLDSTDALVRQLLHTLQRIAVEQPEPVLEGNAQLNELAEHAKLTIDAMAAAIGAHFRGSRDTAALVRAVHDARDTAGRTGEAYHSALFRRDLRLSHKLQLSQFGDAMDQLAAIAADAIDRVVALGTRPLRRLMVRDTGVVATAMSIAAIALALMLHLTNP